MEQRTFDELISHFNSTVSKWEIDLKYKFELLGMISNIGYEHEKMLNNLPSAEQQVTVFCDLDCRLSINGVCSAECIIIDADMGNTRCLNYDKVGEALDICEAKMEVEDESN